VSVGVVVVANDVDWPADVDGTRLATKGVDPPVCRLDVVFHATKVFLIYNSTCDFFFLSVLFSNSA
jgi:hypothetical protein